jgi:hypothetical protein
MTFFFFAWPCLFISFRMAFTVGSIINGRLAYFDNQSLPLFFYNSRSEWYYFFSIPVGQIITSAFGLKLNDFWINTLLLFRYILMKGYCQRRIDPKKWNYIFLFCSIVFFLLERTSQLSHFVRLLHVYIYITITW